MTAKSQISMLATTVRTLAAGPDVQADYLNQLGVAPSADELALEMNDVYPAVRDDLSDGTRRALDLLEAQLKTMSRSDQAELWTTDALRSAPQWTEVRRLAAAAADALEAEVQTNGDY